MVHQTKPLVEDKALDKMQKKVAKVMREYKGGKLKSSSGDKVKSRDQAVAIAMSEAGYKQKDKK